MKHFRNVVLLALCAAIISPTFSQNRFFGWARTTFKHWESDNSRTKFMNPDIAVYATHRFIDTKWSFACFANANKFAGEFVLGPRFHFCPYFYGSLYGGVEARVASWDTLGNEITDCWRIAVDGSFRYKAFNWYNVYEYGGAAGWDGDYWQSDMTYQVHKYLTLEAKAYNLGRDDYRLGGGVMVPIPKTFLEFAPVVLYNFNTEEPEVELSFLFMFF